MGDVKWQINERKGMNVKIAIWMSMSGLRYTYDIILDLIWSLSISHLLKYNLAVLLLILNLYFLYYSLLIIN